MIKTTIAIIIVAFIAIILVVAGALGFIELPFFNLAGDDDPASPNNVNATGIWTNLGLSDREIHAVISFLTNRSPPYIEHQAFINGLHMTVYGANSVTAYEVLQDYEISYRNEDYTSYTTGVQRGPGWTAFAEVWYNDIGMGRGITVGDGSALHNIYGYDCVLMTSYGPILDYYDYVTFLGRY